MPKNVDNSTKSVKFLDSEHRVKKLTEESLKSNIEYNQLLEQRAALESEINKNIIESLEKRNSLDSDIKNHQSLINKLLNEKNELLKKGNNISDFQKNRLIAISDLLKDQNKELLVLNNEYQIIEKYLKQQGPFIQDAIDKNEELIEVTSKIKNIQENTNKALDEHLKKQKAIFEKYDKGIKIINTGKNIVTGTISAVNDLIKPWAAVDNAASKYSKSIGFSQIGYEKIRKSAIALADEEYKLGGTIASQFNITGGELIKLQQGYSEAIGRNVMLTKDASVDMAAMVNVIGDSETMKITSGLEQFGLSAVEVGQKITNLIQETGKHGVVASNVTKIVSENIQIAQNYKFKNGIDGLIKMAENSAKLRLNMAAVAQFADKVSTIEGSITSSANLQVLGGPFANYADPMGMLYESLNDLNGLQDRMSNMFAKMGKFNTKTGEVEVTTFNRLRMKAAAEAMGVSFDDMMKTTQTQAKRGQIEKNLSPEVKKNEDLKEMIINTAFWDKKMNGFAVSIDGKATSVKSLKTSDYEKIELLTKDQGQNIQDIALRLRGWDDAISGTKKGIEAKQASWVDFLGDGTKKMILGINASNFLLGGILAAVLGMKAFSRGQSVYEKIKDFSLGKQPRLNGTSKITDKIGNTMKSGAGRLSIPKGVGPAALIGLGLGAARTATDTGSDTDNLLNVASGTISGAATGALATAMVGAVMGSAVPVIGTAIGMAVGGLIGGAMSIKDANKNKKQYDLNKQQTNIESGEKRINYGSGGLLVGPSHNNGGMPIKNSNVAVEGGEFIINKDATIKNLSLLNKINSGSNIKPIESFAKTTIVSNTVNNSTLNDNISVKPIDLNLNGSIRLDTGNGKTADISPDILKDQTFLRELATMLSKEINIKANGAFNKKNFREKWV